MNILIVGLGLIGGSIAKALRRGTKHKIYALDISEDTLLDAVAMGVIDNKATEFDIGKMDIIYLCIYPKDSLSFVKKHAGDFKKGSIVTDTCGVKKILCREIPAIAKENGFSFVAGHPMAGKEKSGFSESDPSIFYGASYILAESGADEEAVNTVTELARIMGFGRFEYTTAEEHDEIIAFTSQLPHALACAYVLSPRCARHQGYSAGSYRDVSRVADINSDLWTRLFLDNDESLSAEIGTLIKNLGKFKDVIDRRDENALNSLLALSAAIKRSDNR